MRVCKDLYFWNYFEILTIFEAILCMRKSVSFSLLFLFRHQLRVPDRKMRAPPMSFDIDKVLLGEEAASI